MNADTSHKTKKSLREYYIIKQESKKKEKKNLKQPNYPSVVSLVAPHPRPLTPNPPPPNTTLTLVPFKILSQTITLSTGPPS